MTPVIVQPAEGTVRLVVIDYSSMVNNAAACVTFVVIVWLFIWFIRGGGRRREP